MDWGSFGPLLCHVPELIHQAHRQISQPPITCHFFSFAHFLFTLQPRIKLLLPSCSLHLSSSPETFLSAPRRHAATSRESNTFQIVTQVLVIHVIFSFSCHLEIDEANSFSPHSAHSISHPADVFQMHVSRQKSNQLGRGESASTAAFVQYSFHSRLVEGENGHTAPHPITPRDVSHTKQTQPISQRSEYSQDMHIHNNIEHAALQC